MILEKQKKIKYQQKYLRYNEKYKEIAKVESESIFLRVPLHVTLMDGASFQPDLHSFHVPPHTVGH